MNRRILTTRLALAASILATSSLIVRAQQPPQGTPPPAPPPSPVICRVEGRPITQADFDRIGVSYFERLKAEMKDGFTPEVQRIANRNVLDELVRRELLVVAAQRQKIVATESETDQILAADPFFFTNGKFDRGKLMQYKISPGANYLTILPKLRELAAANRLDSLTRARCMPSPAAVRAEWSKRNDQVRFKFLPLATRDMSLDPEASEQDLAAYYAAHPDQFEKKPRVRLHYVRLALPAAADSSRAKAESDSLARARDLAESLRHGGVIDSLAKRWGGAFDTGLFDLPSPAIPGIGPAPELAAALAHADSDTTVRVVGPFVAADAVIVGEVAERVRRGTAPMHDVLADLKRRADAEKRRVHQDEERLAYYQSHRDSYRTARMHVTRVLLKVSAATVASPPPKDIERWYAAHGRTLFAGVIPDSSPLPALTDSLRAASLERMMAEARAAAVERTLAGIAGGWRAAPARGGYPDPRALARPVGAAVETLTLIRGSGADSIFSAGLVDSLFASHAVGTIVGPRRFAERGVMWRVDSYDTTYVPPLEGVRGQVERAVFEARRKQDEDDAQAYFDAHKTDFKTPPRFTVEYIAQRILPADSVKVPEVEIRKYYDAHRENYRHEEEVRARHILIDTRSGQMSERRAKDLADSLRREIVKGADFADLAKRFSQDPGSGAMGGDLGFFARGRMVKEFSDTSFALKPGRVSQPVKTQFGYHLIKVEERRPAGFTPLADVRAQITAQLGTALGDSSAARSARAMRRRLLAGAPVAQVAARAGGVKTSAEFAASDPLPEIGMVQGLGGDLVKLPVGKWAPRVYRSGSAYLLIKPIHLVPPRQAEFAEVKAQAIEDMKTAKRKDLLNARVAAIRIALAAGASLDSVSTPYGGLKDSGPLTRAMVFVPYLGAEFHLVKKAFAAKAGSVSDTLATTQGVAWIQVEQRLTQQGASFAKDAPTIRQELQLKAYSEWVERQKKTVKIEILRPDLREVPPPITRTVTMGGG